MKAKGQNGESKYRKRWPSKKLSILIKRYKMSYGQLKELKIEIEHLQHLLEHARTRLTRDFEHWYVHVYLETHSNNLGSNLTQSISTTSLLDTIQPIEHKEVDMQNTEIQKVSNTRCKIRSFQPFRVKPNLKFKQTSKPFTDVKEN